MPRNFGRKCFKDLKKIGTWSYTKKKIVMPVSSFAFTSQIFEFACELLRIGGSQKQRDTVAGLRLGTTNQRQALECVVELVVSQGLL